MIRRLQDRSLPVRARIEGLFPALKVPQGITPPSPPEEEMFSALERLTPVCADWRPFLQKAKRIPRDRQTPEVRAMLETFGSRVDFVDTGSLTPLLEVLPPQDR